MDEWTKYIRKLNDKTTAALTLSIISIMFFIGFFLLAATGHVFVIVIN